MAKNMLIVCGGLLALTLVGGCRVENHHNGDDHDVKIATPFGGMSVKTDEATVQNGLGLPIYPGATLVKKDSDSNAADVNLSFGNFHLGVKAVSYRTTDDPDKVLAFYRKAMSKYGAVILCKDGRPVGAPAVTQDGLSCKNDSDHNSVHTDEGGNAGELKAGSKQKQHIVSVDREGAGSKFGLVALELPGHLGSDEDGKE